MSSDSNISSRLTPVSARIERRVHQVICKINEKYKCKSQKLNSPNLAVIGAFHGTNVGDNTLGLSILNNLANQQNKNLSGGLQNFYNLQEWVTCEYNICAGGATGVETNLDRLIKRSRISPRKTALIGMDFSGDVDSFSDDILSFLNSVSFLSCRSKRQADSLSSILGREVIYHPDNAFAYSFLKKDFKSIQNSEGKTKILGFNSLPFFTFLLKDRFKFGSLLEDWYRKMGSDIVEYVNLLGPAYIKLIAETIKEYSKQGWKIVHIPFTPEDDLFARTFFDQELVYFYKYRSSPNKIFNLVKKCDLFIPTRYHALIFSLIGQVPCIPILYAVKCSDLLDDLGISKELGINRMELVSKQDNPQLKLLDYSQAITIKKSDLNTLCVKSKNSIDNAINLIQANHR